MGKVQFFDILFDNSKFVFYPGEFVSGRCVVDLRADLKVKSIRVSMHGEAKVHWTESRTRYVGNRSQTYTHHYRDERKFFHIQQELLPPGNSDDQKILTQGRHEFLFAFQLPARNLSTSFEGEYGSIRYWLKAEIVKSWAFNTTTKKAFTVICPIDINRSDFLHPIDNRAEKQVCCFCCASGPISVYASCERRGYCPGESIVITADFENLSRRQIVPRTTLHQIQTFYASGKIKSYLSKYTTIEGPKIQAGEQTSWNGLLMPIPAVAPSVLDCEILRVDYVVRISLEIPGAMNLNLDLPIIMGTVPLRQVATAPNFDIANPQMIPPAAPSKDDMYSQSPPPAYAECVGGPFNIADEDDTNAAGGIKFTPMYAYAPNFNNQSQPPPNMTQELKSPPYPVD